MAKKSNIEKLKLFLEKNQNEIEKDIEIVLPKKNNENNNQSKTKK